MTEEEYANLFSRTLSNSFHSSLLPEGELANCLQAIAVVVAWADSCKRALYYGKEPVLRTGKEARVVTSLRHDGLHAEKLHAALGLFTEAGELLASIQKDLIGEGPLDVVNALEELGDIHWYLALAHKSFDLPPAEVRATNISKLRARFPDKFSEDEAINRNLDVERKTLEASGNN